MSAFWQCTVWLHYAADGLAGTIVELVWVKLFIYQEIFNIKNLRNASNSTEQSLKSLTFRRLANNFKYVIHTEQFWIRYSYDVTKFPDNSLNQPKSVLIMELII